MEWMAFVGLTNNVTETESEMRRIVSSSSTTATTQYNILCFRCIIPQQLRRESTQSALHLTTEKSTWMSIRVHSPENAKENRWIFVNLHWIFTIISNCAYRFHRSRKKFFSLRCSYVNTFQKKEIARYNTEWYDRIE